MNRPPIDYRPAATLHRPDDPRELRREAEHLLSIGLTCDDIAACFGLTKAAVRQLLDDHRNNPNH